MTDCQRTVLGKFFLIFSLLMVAYSLVFVSNSHARERGQLLRIGTIKVLSGLPTYVAVKDKLFEKYGFKTKILFFKSSDLVFGALKAGTIDLVGVAGMSQCLKMLEREPESLRIIGTLYSSTCFVTSKLSNCNDLKDFPYKKNVRIGIFPGSVFGVYTRNALKAENLNVNRIDFVPLPPPLQVNALRDNKVQFLYTLEPFCGIAVGQGFAKYITKLDLFAKNFLNSNKFPGGVVALSSKYTDTDVPKRILAVYKEAMRIINEKNFSKNDYLAQFTDIHTSFFPHMNFEGAAFGSEINMGALQVLVGKLIEWGVVKQPIKLKNSIFDE